LQWILIHLLEIIIIIIIRDKWSVEYSIIGHIMGTLWSSCKKLMHCYETPLSDEWWIRPPPIIIIINSRLGFAAKQLWLTREGLSWIHDVTDPRKQNSHIQV
jgi:hypothetical protein